MSHSHGDRRGYSWPPFAPGNTESLKHGAHSARTVAPLAEQFAAALAESAPWTQSPAFVGAVRSWAWCEAQAQLLRAWLDGGNVDMDADSEPWPVRFLARVESQLIKLRAELGLSPASLGSLLARAASVASAVGDQSALDALRSEGAAILQARTAAELETGGGDDG